MADYGRLRYQTSFFVGERFQVTFDSDLPFATYAPGDVIRTYGGWHNHSGALVMPEEAYRVVRVEHAILDVNDGNNPKAEVILMYVYTAPPARIALIYEGVKTIGRAIFASSILPAAHPLPSGPPPGNPV